MEQPEQHYGTGSVWAEYEIWWWRHCIQLNDSDNMVQSRTSFSFVFLLLSTAVDGIKWPTFLGTHFTARCKRPQSQLTSRIPCGPESRGWGGVNVRQRRNLSKRRGEEEDHRRSLVWQSRFWGGKEDSLMWWHLRTAAKLFYQTIFRSVFVLFTLRWNKINCMFWSTWAV